MTMPTIRNIAAGLCAAIAGAAVTSSAAFAQASCDAFAKISVQQQQENERNKCGLTGPEWSSSFQAVLAWCSAHSPQEANEMLKKRKDALAACAAR